MATAVTDEEQRNQDHPGRSAPSIQAQGKSDVPPTRG